MQLQPRKDTRMEMIDSLCGRTRRDMLAHQPPSLNPQIASLPFSHSAALGPTATPPNSPICTACNPHQLPNVAPALTYSRPGIRDKRAPQELRMMIEARQKAEKMSQKADARERRAQARAVEELEEHCPMLTGWKRETRQKAKKTLLPPPPLFLWPEPLFSSTFQNVEEKAEFQRKAQRELHQRFEARLRADAEQKALEESLAEHRKRALEERLLEEQKDRILLAQIRADAEQKALEKSRAEQEKRVLEAQSWVRRAQLRAGAEQKALEKNRAEQEKQVLEMQKIRIRHAQFRADVEQKALGKSRAEQEERVLQEQKSHIRLAQLRADAEQKALEKSRAEQERVRQETKSRTLRTLPSAAWTLVVMLTLFSSLSGMMVVIALQQTREPACDPHINALRTDDGFWALLSQLFFQVLSAFCTLYPVIINNELKVHVTKFWFMALLTVSLLTAVGAVIAYSWSWKLATVLSFGGGFAQIISAGQLAVSLNPDEKKGGVARRRTLRIRMGMRNDRNARLV